jgi:adenylate cyclase
MRRSAAHEDIVASEPVERRLAAIVAADVAGYSRLVGADEEGTLARLRAIRRELVDPAVTAHRGRIGRCASARPTARLL